MQHDPKTREPTGKTLVPFPLPSFLSGFALALDLGATLRRDSYREFLGRDAEDANATALVLDWFVIGEDARESVQEFDREFAAA